MSSFIILTKIGQLFVGIDSSGFKATYTSQVLCRKSKTKKKKTNPIVDQYTNGFSYYKDWYTDDPVSNQ